MKLCDRCTKNNGDIYLKDKNIRLCKKCITGIIEERAKYWKMYIDEIRRVKHRAETAQVLHAKYQKQIKGLEELIKFMHEH